MSKAPIKSSDLVKDIHNGMDDDELMKKYELLSTQLAAVFTRLIEANRITQAELDTRNLILDAGPLQQTNPSDHPRIVFVATSVVCSVLFGVPFLLMVMRIAALLSQKHLADNYIDGSIGYRFLTDAFYAVIAAALTFFPPLLVWIRSKTRRVSRVSSKS